MASHNFNKKCISIPGKIKYVYENELQDYLNIGWKLGNQNDCQKSKHKKWFNNGNKNILISEGDEVPEGFVPGMYQKRPGGYTKYQYKWYTNGVEQKRLSILKGDKIPDGWFPGQCESHKLKNKQS